MSHEHDYKARYAAYTRRKVAVTAGLALAVVLAAVYAVYAGSSGLSLSEVLRALARTGDETASLIVWNIRLPRVMAAIVAGTGLAVSGAVMQGVLRNPLASPFTLGVSQGAAFGAALAIIGFGAGATGTAAADAVRISNVWSVAGFAFAGAMVATLAVLAISRTRGATPETIVLAGVALGSLFSAATALMQYFAEDTQVAAVVFWTFGDLGRAAWRDIGLMAVVVGVCVTYFFWHRWDYNALETGAESAHGLGVHVERVRLLGMLAASFATAAIVAFLGIIGFIGLVGPHLVRRVMGSDHRFLLPASAAAGALLLLVADTVGRTLISPVVLPVGAITSFLGAPLFLYLLVARRRSA
ncbi:iron ABC transporter permease [Coriobacteriia bacterium M08DHB]|nr:iron ABC transporter permease [Anaerosoma tenue]MCK8114840.1 iron ABC transporter permease [Anaerosoma tenue]